MNFNHIWIVVIFMVYTTVHVAQCQRQVFALIPLDGPSPFRPQKNKLAVVTNETNPVPSTESTTTTDSATTTTTTTAPISEIQVQPLALPNSIPTNISNGVNPDSAANNNTIPTGATPIPVNPQETVVVTVPTVTVQNATAPKVELLPVLPPIQSTGDNPAQRPTNIHPPKGVYVKTSAQEKACQHHWDCYGRREPDEWCPLGESERFLDKGCFCDLTRNLCTMQRLTETGAQYSDCAEKSTSACAGLGGNIVKARQRLSHQ